ncbi:4136_t:CDS:2 [Dentiscutata heterogama]|uniref:4136_t:CDS:1 n=1 Tax=Dentiscutata heterogama TaxID=1316150 RepID=A0ACA9MHS9_9GLOM|nr:4136_t:CDS:2 [Dentiscutata heterogama]
MYVILDVQEFEIPEFFRLEGETSKKMGERFELFCIELLRRYFERLGYMLAPAKYDYETCTQLNCQFRGNNDGGVDIIVELCGYKIAIQCKAYFCQNIDRKLLDEFKTVVREGDFDFGVFVGVLDRRISLGAYVSAGKSEHDIIVATYKNMCENIKNLIAGRLSQKFCALEDRRRFLENRRRLLEDSCKKFKFAKLEQNDKNTATENAGVVKLEQKQLQNDSSNIIDTSPKLLEDDTGENNQSSVITPCKMNSDELNNAPNSDVSFEDNSSEQSNLSCEIKTVTSGNDQNLELASDTKTVNIDNNAELYSSDSSDEVSGLDRNQITEQTLKRDFTKSTVIVKSNEIDNELSLEKTTGDSTQRLAYWFEKAIKSDYENSKTVTNGNDRIHVAEISTEGFGKRYMFLSWWNRKKRRP